MASSSIMNLHPLLMIIMLSCLATSQSVSIFESVWPTANNTATGQTALESNSTIQPMIKLNLVGSNPSLANAFTMNATNQQLENDDNFLNQFRINPQDIQFIVPNQPDQLGSKIVEQIQQQLGNKPISLAELKNKNLTFSVEMPGVQFNRTVQTNISDETIVRRSGSAQRNVGPYVMQSYMKKPPSIPSAIQAFQSNNYGKPIVYVTPDSPNHSKNYSTQAAVPTPMSSYSVPLPVPPPLSAAPPTLKSFPPPVNYSIAATGAKPLLGYLQQALPIKYPPPSAKIFKASAPGNQSNTFIPPPAKNYLTGAPVIPAEYTANSYPAPALALFTPPPPPPPPPPPSTPKIINYTVKPLIGQLAQPIPLTDDSYLTPPLDPTTNEFYVVQSPEITKGFLAPPPLPVPPPPPPKTYVVNAPPPPSPPPNPIPLALPPPPPPSNPLPLVPPPLPAPSSNYSAPQNSTKIFKMYQGSAIPAAFTNGSQTLNYAPSKPLPPPPPPPPSPLPPQKPSKTFVAQPKPSTAEPPTLFNLKKLQKPLKAASGYTPEQTYPQPKSELYISQAPPLLNPKSDYESYVKVAANQPEILYRYIEVCNGKPVSNYGDVYSNVQKNAQELKQAVESGYSEYFNMQSKLESSLSQMEYLKQMVQYYQNLVPYLSTYAQKYADVAAKSPQNPYQPIVVPQYPNLPAYPSTYQQQVQTPVYTVSASGSKPYQPKSAGGTYDNGQIKISYNSVEETLKTDSSNLPDLIQVY